MVSLFFVTAVLPPVAAANGAGAISIFERLLYLPRNFDLMNLG